MSITVYQLYQLYLMTFVASKRWRLFPTIPHTPMPIQPNCPHGIPLPHQVCRYIGWVCRAMLWRKLCYHTHLCWSVLLLFQEPTESGNTGPWLADNQSRGLNNQFLLVVYLVRSVPDQCAPSCVRSGYDTNIWLYTTGVSWSSPLLIWELGLSTGWRQGQLCYLLPYRFVVRL